MSKGSKEDFQKIGVVVKGCDSRAIVQIIQEKGLNREDLVIIGIPCKGVIDPKKINKQFQFSMSVIINPASVIGSVQRVFFVFQCKKQINKKSFKARIYTGLTNLYYIAKIIVPAEI